MIVKRLFLALGLMLVVGLFATSNTYAKDLTTGDPKFDQAYNAACGQYGPALGGTPEAAPCWQGFSSGSTGVACGNGPSGTQLPAGSQTNAYKSACEAGRSLYTSQHPDDGTYKDCNVAYPDHDRTGKQGAGRTQTRDDVLYGGCTYSYDHPQNKCSDDPNYKNDTKAGNGETVASADRQAACQTGSDARNNPTNGSTNGGNGGGGAINTCTAGGIIGFPRWYDGICKEKDGVAEIQSPNDVGGIAKFLTIIAMNIVGMILYLVGLAALVFIIWGGIKYMLSGDNASGVSEARKTIMNACIGLVISIMAIAIVKVIAGAIS